MFLPPTLIGTLYGMNFAVMPELSWKYGFIYSMVLTLSAAILPLWYIKRRGWCVDACPERCCAFACILGAPMSTTVEQAQAALQKVVDPNTGKDLMSSRSARNVRVDGDDVSVDVELGYPAARSNRSAAR